MLVAPTVRRPKLRRVFALLAASVLAVSPCFAQGIGPPVDIPIQNIPQQTQVWCWAAVAQQIILASRGPAQTPDQCALVALANGAGPGVCCNYANPACLQTGSVPQIQWLISQFGGNTSAWTPPLNPMSLYQVLAQGHPVIVQLVTGPASAHVVVVRGMSFQPSPYGGIVPMVSVNDPMAVYTQPVPFASLSQMWASSIIVN